MFLQIGVQSHLTAEVADHQGQVTDDQPCGVDRGGFGVLGIDAGIADVWIRQGHDLTTVRRVGQDFLVTRHRRVEDNLSDCLPLGSDGSAAEHAAIFEY